MLNKNTNLKSGRNAKIRKRENKTGELRKPQKRENIDEKKKLQLNLLMFFLS